MDKAGVGSAVMNSMRQVGGALGLAVMGAIVASQVNVASTSPRFPAQFVSGYQRALEVAAAIAFAAAILAVLTVRRHADAGDVSQMGGDPAVSAEEARAA